MMLPVGYRQTETPNFPLLRFILLDFHPNGQYSRTVQIVPDSLFRFTGLHLIMES